jgi:AraC-like DNA-binding protein
MNKIPVYGLNEFSKGGSKTSFYSNDLRTHLESHKFVNSPHKHNTYITIFFTKGSGEHLIDFDKFAVKPGSVFLLNPGQVHSWKLSKDVDGFVFIHTKEFYDGLFVNRKIEDFPFFYLQQNYPVIYLLKKERERIENLLVMIHETFKKESEYRLVKLGSLIDLIYIELAQLYIPSGKIKTEANSNYLKVVKLQQFIDKNFKTKKFPSDYADLMNMSIRHLNRICQDTVNKSTGDLIFDRIILEAKRILIHNDVSISQVADELGYEDQSYFIRLFKKKTGVSPKEFQQKMLKPFSKL